MKSISKHPTAESFASIKEGMDSYPQRIRSVEYPQARITRGWPLQFYDSIHFQLHLYAKLVILIKFAEPPTPHFFIVVLNGKNERIEPM